uniref:Uncharacterized protein n=1 Tax=Leersia perrieri TaxID=77586 RepID=A0A0D9XNC4_9ORYZ
MPSFVEQSIWHALGLALVSGAFAGSALYALCSLLLCCLPPRHAAAPPADPRKVKLCLPDHAHRRSSPSSSSECSICLGELEEGERFTNQD